MSGQGNEEVAADLQRPKKKTRGNCVSFYFNLSASNHSLARSLNQAPASSFARSLDQANPSSTLPLSNLLKPASSTGGDGAESESPDSKLSFTLDKLKARSFFVVSAVSNLGSPATKCNQADLFLLVPPSQPSSLLLIICLLLDRSSSAQNNARQQRNR